MTGNLLVIGSRGSKLALTQSELIKEALLSAHPSIKVEIKVIKTKGDKILDVSLSKIGGKGLFTKEIEEELLAGEIDLAVHSLKDLPIEVPNGLKIGAITEREEPFDALVSEDGVGIKELASNVKVGTSSLRRQAQLLHIRHDLETVDLRGNLDTRIRKLNEGEYDAIIVACAGLNRLGLDVNKSVIPISEILPQAGQGALGIEIRDNDLAVESLVKILDNSDSRICAQAERVVLSELGGGCQVPIGVYAEIKDGYIEIKAGVFSLDGLHAIKADITGDKAQANELAKELAQRLLHQGAKEILDSIK